MGSFDGDVRVEERAGELEKGERDHTRVNELLMAAEAEYGVLDLERESRQSVQGW